MVVRILKVWFRSIFLFFFYFEFVFDGDGWVGVYGVNS